MRLWFSFVLTLTINVPAAAQVVAVDPPIRSTMARSDDGLKVYVGGNLGAEVIDLTGETLGFGDPEIAVLQGHRLDPGWLQGAGLGETGIASVSLVAGMRGLRFLRGPEVSLHYGGGGGNGEDFRPSGVEGIELALGSVEILRLSVAIGAQLALGEIVVPYLLGRAGMGVAFIDVEVREERLGALGSETLDRAIFELGVEAGIGIRPRPGVELGILVRANLLGAQSFGGAFTVSVAPEEA